MRSTAVALLALLSPLAAVATAPSPYATEHGREIAALSADDIASLLAGKGMGLARAAELNGYPGPMHVLELAAELGLTPRQREATAALFARMQTDARALGARIVEAERVLDGRFRARTVETDALAQALREVAGLQGQLRHVHLAAHLEQVELLTPEQRARYDQLRGYGGKPRHDRAHGKH